MGYLSHYHLTWQLPEQRIGEPPADPRQRAMAQEEANAQIIAAMEKTEWWEWLQEGAARKWYERNQDMLSIAQQFPEVVFILDRFGEESLDLKRTYFRGDQKYEVEAIVTFPDFDPGKLGTNGKAI